MQQMQRCSLLQLWLICAAVLLHWLTCAMVVLHWLAPVVQKPPNCDHHVKRIMHAELRSSAHISTDWTRQPQKIVTLWISP